MLLHDLTSLDQGGVDLAVAQRAKQHERLRPFSSSARTLLIISGSRSNESGTWKPASFIACSVQDAQKLSMGILDLGRRPCFSLLPSPCRRGPGRSGFSGVHSSKEGSSRACAPACPNCTCSRAANSCSVCQCSQRLKRLRSEARGTSAHAPGYDWLGDSALLHGLTFPTTRV